MNAEQLSRVGEKLVKRCGSRDPFEIARQLGINVMLCENFGSLKGMYRVIKRNRFIFLNNSLDENMLRIVCAHELGHDQLHRNMAKTTPIHEFMLYDMKSKPEYEANIVAAEILMDSDEVLRYIYEYGYTAEQIASAVYAVRLPAAFAEGLDHYNGLDAAPVLKKSKRGQKEIDLKEHCPRLDYVREGDEVCFEMQLPAGEGLNLNPSLWLGFLQEHCGVDATQAHVLRKRLITKNSEDFA